MSRSRGGVDPGGLVKGELLLADRQDGVGVEAVEGAQCDELVVALATESPVVRTALERALAPGGIAIDGRTSRRGGSLQSPSIAFRQADSGSLDLVEERRQVPGGLHLEALPEPDLGDGRPGSCFIEICRDGLEPTTDGFQSLRQRREVLGEDQEQAVADDVEGGRAPFPGSDDLGVEDRPTDVMDLEVALDASRRREPSG